MKITVEFHRATGDRPVFSKRFPQERHTDENLVAHNAWLQDRWEPWLPSPRPGDVWKCYTREHGDTLIVLPLEYVGYYPNGNDLRCQRRRLVHTRIASAAKITVGALT